MNALIYSVLLGHFIAAFAVLGMPLFLPYVLPSLSGSITPQWIGMLYILPTLCTATVAGFWGRFADCRGRRLSLLRAQLGMAVGFFDLRRF
jgi:MFS family permease